MARKPADLKTPTSRSKLQVRKCPYTVVIVPGGRLAYRRNAGPGNWSVITKAGLARFALADDREPADGQHVMDYWQAAAHVRLIIRGPVEAGRKQISVAEAVEAYRKYLQHEGRSTGNATRLKAHIPAALAAALVCTLKRDDLSSWRSALIKTDDNSDGVTRSTADVLGRALKAALALAARDDARIVNVAAWRDGLRKLKDADTPREPPYLEDDMVCAVAAAAYPINLQYGFLIDAMAMTGNRFSQLIRLRVADLIDQPPKLLVPSSRKGRKKAKQEHVPIMGRLAKALRAAAEADGRSGAAPLLVDPEGKPWTREVPPKDWAATVAAVGLPADAIPYWLRHSSVIRKLLKGVQIILV